MAQVIVKYSYLMKIKKRRKDQNELKHRDQSTLPQDHYIFSPFLIPR